MYKDEFCNATCQSKGPSKMTNVKLFTGRHLCNDRKKRLFLFKYSSDSEQSPQ